MGGEVVVGGVAVGFVTGLDRVGFAIGLVALALVAALPVMEVRDAIVRMIVD
jgi:hypothetical protein